MSTVIIFPGGFQPFHAGHKSVYDYLINKFPDADVYVASSPSTTERPFNFEDKKYLAVSAGIPEDKFVMVKSPYRSIEITQNYNPEKDVVIFALSEKDSSRLSYTKKDGSPGYFQPYEDNKDLNSFGKNGYVYITPKISFKVLGNEIESASKIRSMYKNASEEEQNNILKDMYPGGDMKKIKTIFDNTLTEEFDIDGFLEEGFKELNEEGIYASYKLTQESAKQLTNWIKETGIKDPVEYDDLHVTTTYSRNYANIVPSKKMIHVKNETYSLDVFGEALVLRIDSPDLQNIHDSAIQNGATSDYLKYNPHITLSYNAKINEDIIMTGLEPPKFDIILSHEEVEPLEENVKPKRSLVKVMKEYKNIKKKISGIGVEGKATEDLQEIIQKKGSQWVLKSKKSGKVLGKFPSKKKALKREKQIQYFKHIKEEKESKKLTKKQQKIESRLETLLKYGLVPKNLIARARRALFDQKVAAKTPYLRDLLIDILDHVLKMVLDNPILYHRLLRDVMIKGPIVQEEVSDNNENDKNIEIPEKVFDVASVGIALRKEFNRGGTSTIVTLSKELINSGKVNKKFIKKLQKSLKIHTPKRKEGWDDSDKPSNEYITWQLLGGDAAVSWVEKTINNIEEE